MTGSRLRMIAIVLLAATTAAACASTTSGSGTVGRSLGRGGSSGPDFPSGSATVAPPPTGAGTPGSSSSASASPTVHPAPADPLRTVDVNAPGGATYVVKIWAEVRDDTCFDHAYGETIVTFLTQHPCTGLRRVLGTTTVNGRPVGFAESATGFHGPADDPYEYAGQFGKLEEKDGTGSINDLLREGYRLPDGPTSIPASEAFNVLGQDEGVTVWDVWYLDGPTPTNAKALVKMTQDLFLQF